MRTVVVTGAAGMLGQRVLARLSASPELERIVGFDRDPLPEYPASVQGRIVDLAGEPGAVDSALDAAMVGADALIHLAWVAEEPHPRRRAGRLGDPAALNHRVARRVLDAAERAGVERVVHLSSATVYGAWPDNPVPLTEEAVLRPNPELGFAVAKADVERMVVELAEQHPEMAVSILRPVATVAPEERAFYRALGGLGAPRTADAARRVQFLHVDDLADAVLLAVSVPLRGAYNVAPDEGIGEDTAGALAGGAARLVLPPALAAAVSSWGWRVGGSGAPAGARAYSLHSWVVAADRLRAAGWQPRYSSAEALVATDDRLHWDDLPPGRRQNYTLLVALGALGALGGTGAWALTRRRRALRPR